MPCLSVVAIGIFESIATLADLTDNSFEYGPLRRGRYGEFLASIVSWDFGSF
jgi:hypothetical protein